MFLSERVSFVASPGSKGSDGSDGSSMRLAGHKIIFYMILHHENQIDWGHVFAMLWLPAPRPKWCEFVCSWLGRGQCGTDVAREGALQLVKAMEALNPTQEPAKQQGEALIHMSCVDYRGA